MTVFICVDDGGGVAFNGRRQSRDGRVIENAAEFGCARLFVTGYSAPLFEGKEVCVSETPFEDAGPCDGVFAERTGVSEYLGEADALVIYRWNRRYPSDLRFSDDPAEYGLHLAETSEFEGTSHERITREVWRRV